MRYSYPSRQGHPRALAAAILERAKAQLSRTPAGSPEAAELTELIAKCEDCVASLMRASVRLACACGPSPITETDPDGNVVCVLCARVLQRRRKGRASKRRSLQSSLGNLSVSSSPRPVPELKTRLNGERRANRSRDYSELAWAAYVEKARTA